MSQPTTYYLYLTSKFNIQLRGKRDDSVGIYICVMDLKLDELYTVTSLLQDIVDRTVEQMASVYGSKIIHKKNN